MVDGNITDADVVIVMGNVNGNVTHCKNVVVMDELKGNIHDCNTILGVPKDAMPAYGKMFQVWKEHF